MLSLETLIAIAILILFVGIVTAVIYASRKEKEKIGEVAHTLGFRAVEPDDKLIEAISRIYLSVNRNARYEFRNVFHRKMPDGEMYLFDLTDTSGDDNSQTEQQAVAVVSEYLDLPHFILYPKANLEGWAGNLANKLIDWAATRAGTRMEFPDNPGFAETHLLSSLDPDKARAFFHSSILQQLSQNHLGAVQGLGHVFVYSQVILSRKPVSYESINERVNEARNIFRIMQM